MKNKCRICGSNNLLRTYYPDIHFNNKVFKYYKCNNCKTYNVFPSPDESDFILMYGETDHTYLRQIQDKIQYDFNYPYGNHQGYQIKFLKKNEAHLKSKLLLDYACGSGFYMKFAESLGAEAVGIEFDENFVKILKEKTDLNIYSFEQFKKEYDNIKFDFIHLGHVLEHLVNPYKTVRQLIEFANEDTIFLIDGPLERNFCFSRVYINFGSYIKRKKYNEFPPQHLTLTTAKSQLLFFNKVGLVKDKYFIVEQFFSLPSKLSKSLGSIVSYFVSNFSIFISLIIPSFGNVFHFRGKIDKDLL